MDMWQTGISIVWRPVSQVERNPVVLYFWLVRKDAGSEVPGTCGPVPASRVVKPKPEA